MTRKQFLHSSASCFYFYPPHTQGLPAKNEFYCCWACQQGRASLYKIIVPCCSVLIAHCLPQAPQRASCSSCLLHCPLAAILPPRSYSQAPKGQLAPRVHLCSCTDRACHCLGLQHAEPGGQAAWCCWLVASSASSAHLAEGLHLALSCSLEEKVFSEGRKRIAMLFLNLPGMLPMQAGFRIVFSSSPLGQTLLCLFVKRKDVVAHDLGEKEAALVSLLYLFVISVAWFLKISRVCWAMSSVCLPTPFFLVLLANFILNW